MKKSFTGQLLTATLAATAVLVSPSAFAEVVAGTKITLTNGVGANPGGAFNGTVVSGAAGTWNNSFQSFCLEFNEGIAFGETYRVNSVTNHTENAPGTAAYGASTQDPISAQTAWLFTQFFNNGLYNGLTNTSLWGTGSEETKNTALQQAIWSFEGEAFGSLSTLAANYKANADYAIAHGWSGIGNVRVLNLFGTDAAGNYTIHKQDQLYMVSAVPEPETYAMLLAGLGLMGTIVRRRKAKAA